MEAREFCRDSDLTIEEVKRCAIFSNVTDEEAQEIILAIKQFTLIVYDFCQKKTSKSLDK